MVDTAPATSMRAWIDQQELVLRAQAVVPNAQTVVTWRLHSERNARISSWRECSAHDPDPVARRRAVADLAGETWYPVVDLDVPRGGVGILQFADDMPVEIVVNPPYWRQKETVRHRHLISGEKLLIWENAIWTATTTPSLNAFWLEVSTPVVGGQATLVLPLAGLSWSGRVELASAEGRPLAVTTVVTPLVSPAPPTHAGTQEELLTREHLEERLAAMAAFTLRSQVRDHLHPACGGLHLFYDLDARVYRSSHWAWGWGPSVSFLLQAAACRGEETWREAAIRLGEVGLRFCWQAPGHRLHGMLISRWDRHLSFPEGHRGAITPADALFFAAWAWIPLYQATGDARFRDAAATQANISTALLDEHPTIIPHSFWLDDQAWDDWVIDETGFGAEGFAALHELTPDATLVQAGRRFMEAHLRIFGRDDGLWNRIHFLHTGETRSGEHMTRGLGWALEGLLAMHRLDPGGPWLDHARRMTAVVLPYQREDGAWAFCFDRDVADVGFSEKGTPLWSWLLYELHAVTGETRYLAAARKALTWCLRHLDMGDDPEAHGSIVGCSPQSGVGYRPWFRVACTYAVAFAGLAAIAECNLQARSAS